MSIILAFRREEGTERRIHERRKCVTEQRNGASKQGIKASVVAYVQPEQPAPERPGSTKRGRSVNRGGERGLKREDKEVVLLCC